MNAWWWVAGVVLSTVACDLLQSADMKAHGEIHDLRPGALGRAWGGFLRRRYFLISIVFMALSFFSFLQLLKVADLSFAVPATAASFVLETMLARVVLRERVDGRRWAGAGLVAAGVALLAV